MSNNEDKLNLLLDYLDRLEYVPASDIPNMNLYMDQVTSFMDEHLASSRHLSDDKILTKTMINNYAKNRLLPAPVKKRYSKNHMLLLILIYYFKNVTTFNDIEQFLAPITEKHFAPDADLPLPEVYSEIFSNEKELRAELRKELLEKFSRSEKKFTESPPEEREYLQLFQFICELTYDVYLKKEMIGMLAAMLREENPPKKK